MKKQVQIDIDIVRHPIEGPSIGISFSQKIKYFGLTPEKAERFARHILDLIKQIETHRAN